jgi:hypothetical protein
MMSWKPSRPFAWLKRFLENGNDGIVAAALNGPAGHFG